MGVLRFLPSMNILMPTRQYTEDSAFQALRGEEADAALILSITNVSETQVQVPGASVTQGIVNSVGDTVWYSAVTYRTGGYYLSFPHVKFEVRLIDVASRKTAWIATARTAGSAFASLGVIMDSLASTVLGQLAADGHIPVTEITITSLDDLKKLKRGDPILMVFVDGRQEQAEFRGYHTGDPYFWVTGSRVGRAFDFRRIRYIKKLAPQ